MFAPLLLYPNTDITVTVGGREGASAARDRELARPRARGLVDHLVSRGIGAERFIIRIEPGATADDGTLSARGQRVRVRAEARRP